MEVPILRILENDLNPCWLSLALQTTIRNFKWRYLKKSGGCVVLIFQIDSDDLNIPRSLVLKCHDLDEKTRTLQADSLMYEREFSFYKNISPTLEFNSPQVYALHQYNKEFFYIIMENLLEKYEMAKFNQDGGISGESMKVAISEVKNLHLKFWEDRSLLDTYPFFEKEVLSDQLSRILTFKENWQIVKSQLPTFCGWNFPTPNRFPEDMQDLFNFLEYLAIDDNSLQYYHKANSILSKRPFTLLHGDLNCSNFFFPKHLNDNSSKNICFIDYGMTRSGPVALEFLTFWSTLSITNDLGIICLSSTWEILRLSFLSYEL